MYLVVQLKSKMMSFNLGNGESRFYETNSTVPFLQHHPDPTSDAHIALEASPSAIHHGLSFYVHSGEVGQQVISQLDLSPVEQPKFTNVMDCKGAKIIKM